MRPFIVLFVLAFTFPALAQQADLSVDLRFRSPEGTGNVHRILVSVLNSGPDAAQEVRVKVTLPAGTQTTRLDLTGCTAEGDVVTCGFGTLEAGQIRGRNITTTTGAVPATTNITAEVTSSTPDPVPGNNFLSVPLEVRIAAELRIFNVDALPAVTRPGRLVEWRVELSNEGSSAAENVELTMELPEGSGFVEITANFDAWNCVNEGLVLRCTRPLVEADDISGVHFAATAPGLPEGGRVELRATLTSTTFDPDTSNNTRTGSLQIYRMLEVTTTADSGEGSLREALTLANDKCSSAAPCRIEFAIATPLPDFGWHTIRPLSELPPVGEGTILDATTQSAAFGDTNPFGPEIELNGSLAGDAEGLILSGCASRIQGFAISGFERNGVFVTPWECLLQSSIDGNYIGTDATGKVASPNGLRGIGSYSSGRGRMNIGSNTISGNAHSGIWIEGSDYLIVFNRIGLSATGDEPLPNGASGIYFGPTAGDSEVSRNIIAFNSHWGIAIDPAASSIGIRRNSIHSNFALGIDYGLDFVTENAADDRITDHPVLTSAVYDAATNTTRIAGVYAATPPASFRHRFVIELFANARPDDSGHGEGEVYLGELTLDGVAFEFSFAGDLRGRWISATATSRELLGFKGGESPDLLRESILESTSEFSNSVRVGE